MKKKILVLIATFSFLLTNAQTIEDKVCWKYFDITAKLKSGQSLDKQEWLNFLRDEAIQIYLKDQGVDSAYIESYRKIMEIVYMPQNDSLLKERLKDQNKNWWTYIVNEYKVHEEEMKNYLLGLQKNPKSYFEKCYQYTYQMLPLKYHVKAPEYKITIIPVHNDAHVRNGWMIFTLMAAYFSDLNKEGVLGGHEFHHVLRPRMVFQAADEDRVIISLLQRMLNEGSADLIDKRYEGEEANLLLEFQRGYPESFISEGKKIIRNIDSLLSSDNIDKSKLSINQLINTWNTSGHIPGYYMTNIIEKNGFKQDLIDHIEDPFYLIYLYQKAALKDMEAYPFSDKTMELVKKLDDKYRPHSQVISHASNIN